MKQYEFTGQCFLESSRLDKEGAKHILFEFSASSAVEIAKLELISRDLKNHQPVLLEMKVKRIHNRGKLEKGKTATVFR